LSRTMAMLDANSLSADVEKGNQEYEHSSCAKLNNRDKEDNHPTIWNMAEEDLRKESRNSK